MNSLPEHNERKNIFVIFLTFLFVYVVLFEFILPVNKILPKPTLLYESYISLWFDYNLLFAAAVTTTVVYFALIIGYLFITFFSMGIVKLMIEAPGLFNAPRIFRYFSPFFFALLFVYWFDDSFLAEMVFGFLIAFYAFGLALYKSIPAIKIEYVDFAKSLGAGKNKIYSHIVWKSCQPSLFGEMKKLHYSLWLFILTYEFIAQTAVGGIYRTALQYNDLAAIFALGIMVCILILFGNFVIGFLKKKIIYWE